MGASIGYGSSSTAAKGQTLSRIDPELLVKLHEINLKREAVNAANATVTIEELGEFPVEPEPKKDKEEEKDRQ